VPQTIRIARPVLKKMLAESRRNPAHESCGLLAGKNNSITAIFQARNDASAPATSYEIAPRELFSLFREIRAQNLELLGIYHSHPGTENVPSPTDIARAYYPDAAYFIISPAPNTSKPVRAFQIKNGIVSELQIEEVL
jgi:proteasome lid subunit RPN8/RPN11